MVALNTNVDALSAVVFPERIQSYGLSAAVPITSGYNIAGFSMGFVPQPNSKLCHGA
jgi:hypothetical protein